jgi:anti-anti-sigma factor
MDRLNGNDGAKAEATVEILSDAGAAVVVRVVGELDISNIASLRAALEPLLASRPERLVFDFDGLLFMDSSTIALLLEWTDVCAVEIRKASRPVRRVIEITGLSGVLDLQP